MNILSRQHLSLSSIILSMLLFKPGIAKAISKTDFGSNGKQVSIILRESQDISLEDSLGVTLRDFIDTGRPLLKRLYDRIYHSIDRNDGNGVYFDDDYGNTHYAMRLQVDAAVLEGSDVNELYVDKTVGYWIRDMTGGFVLVTPHGIYWPTHGLGMSYSDNAIIYYKTTAFPETIKPGIVLEPQFSFLFVICDDGVCDGDGQVISEDVYWKLMANSGVALASIPASFINPGRN